MVLNSEICLSTNLPALLKVEVHVCALLELGCVLRGWIVASEPRVVPGVVAPVACLEFLRGEVLFHRSLLAVEDKEQRVDVHFADNAEINHTVVR